MLFIIIMLILGSTSPRRIDLLREQGYDFKIIEPNFDEILFSNELKPEELVKKNAQGKGYSISIPQKNCVILSADTIVVLNNTILGKPSSKENALEMLLSLNNKKHSVLTAYTIIRYENEKTDLIIDNIVESFVYFGKFENEDFIKYAKTNEPEGKAGAYAIQGLASRFIEKIEGSYTNIVGLPVFEVMRDLNKAGIKYPWK